MWNSTSPIAIIYTICSQNFNWCSTNPKEDLTHNTTIVVFHHMYNLGEARSTKVFQIFSLPNEKAIAKCGSQNVITPIIRPAIAAKTKQVLPACEAAIQQL